MSAFCVLCLAVTCAVFLASKSTQADLHRNRPSAVVQTVSGAVVGKIETLPHGKSVHEYLGIPYAEPPVGELRFAAPKCVKPWSGIKHATKYGASCPQNIQSISGGGNDESRVFLYLIQIYFYFTLKKRNLRVG